MNRSNLSQNNFFRLFCQINFLGLVKDFITFYDYLIIIFMTSGHNIMTLKNEVI